jgi:hypothetical protein
MARARNIKPGFFKNELLAELPISTRLIFIGLWCLADREGRLENRPKRIKLELLPFDSVDVGQALDELEQHGFIERYEASGLQVIHILNFSKHQSPHGTERDSHLPGKDGALTVNKRGKNGYVLGNQQLDNSALTVNPPLDNALNPDSLNPDSPNPDKREPRKRSDTPRPKSGQTTLETYIQNCKANNAKPVPDGHNVRAWANDVGITIEMLQIAWIEFRRRYTESEKGKGKKYKDWPGHFANAVKANWFGVWFIDDSGVKWSSKGLGFKAAEDVRMNRLEAVNG